MELNSIDQIKDIYLYSGKVNGIKALGCLQQILKTPYPNLEEDVDFLISKVVCPVDDDHLLVTVINQKSFSGQLRIIRQLIAAGAPINQAKKIANQKFEFLWELITETVPRDIS